MKLNVVVYCDLGFHQGCSSVEHSSTVCLVLGMVHTTGQHVRSRRSSLGCSLHGSGDGSDQHRLMSRGVGNG